MALPSPLRDSLVLQATVRAGKDWERARGTARVSTVDALINAPL